MQGKYWFRVLLMGLMVMTLVMAGCEGDDGSNGAPGAPGVAGTDGTDGAAGASAYDIAVANGYTGTYEEYAALVTPALNVEPESCATCHAGAGDQHQAVYNQYTDASTLKLTLDPTSYTETQVNTASLANFYDATVQFTVTQAGVVIQDLATLNALPQKTFYKVGYNATNGTFENSVSLSTRKLVGSGVFSATGRYNVATLKPGYDTVEVYGYVTDGQLLPTFGHITLYDNVSNAGALVTSAAPYESAANVNGCKACHGDPYMKHGYRGSEITGLGDFAGCKTCHYDSRAGHTVLWQIMANDPVRAAEIEDGSPTTPAEELEYAYTANVMNDTHMSHAMEFPYPQTMANCNACHDGKLDMILTDANFNITTCKSCHPVTGDVNYPSMAPPLTGTGTTGDYPGVIPHGWDNATVCVDCHKVGGIAPVFSQIHIGYNPVVNYSETEKYSDAITVKFASATYNATTMNMAIVANVTTVAPFKAADVNLNAAKWGLYAYDSDDLMASRLDATTAAANAYISNVTDTGLTWTMNADLSDYADDIASGNVNRAQVMIQPGFNNSAGDMVALNAPTEIVKLTDGSFKGPLAIVDEAKCNACHNALGTTFHSPDRGGNIEACKTCHVATSGGSHLEMQSRSIDSYVHAIHSFQPFDYGDINFNDPVEASEYVLDTEDFVLPTFTTLSCEACHNPGTYNVPDQSVSLAAVQSASSTNDTTTRNIGNVPSVVTGPASNACGGCHRAMFINEDDANGLTAFNQHTSQFGYRVENASGIWTKVVETIQSYFE